MSGFFTDSGVCDSEWDESWIPSQGSIKDDYTFTWRAPWKKFQIRVIKSNGLTQQCCSSLLNPLKMQFLTEKDLHLEKLYHVLKKQKYNVIHIGSTTELLEIKLISPNVSDIVSEIEAALANEFDDIILKTIQVFPHTPKLAEKLFWTNLKDGNLTLMSDDAKIFIVGFAKMRAIIQDTIYEIDRCSITETVKFIEDWKPKVINKFSLIETLSTKFKDVKCTFDEENSCVHLAGLDVTVSEVISEMEQLLSSLFVAKLSFDPLVLKLLKHKESSELLNGLLNKEKIIAVWTVDETGLFVFSRVKNDNNDILRSIVYSNFLAVGFLFKDGHNNSFCKSKYFLELIKSNKNKLLVEETSPTGINIAATKTIVQQFFNLENLWNNYNAVISNCIQDHCGLHSGRKKIYSREFLLHLQFAQTSTNIPKQLPDLPEVILKNPIFRYNEGISVGCVFPYPSKSVAFKRNEAHSKPFYPQQQSMRKPQQRMQMGQQQGQMYPTLMYMPPSQPGNTINSYGAPIIIQPNPGQMPQTMMIPGQRMPTPSTTYNISTTQTVGGYPMRQTTYTIMYPVQTSQRPPSAQGMGQPPQMPQKQERKVLQIIDLNTGKDILSDMNRSTPPGSSGSGSRGQTPNETMDVSLRDVYSSY